MHIKKKGSEAHGVCECAESEVAQSVGADGVGVGLSLGADKVPHGPLVSGHAVEGAKLF